MFEDEKSPYPDLFPQGRKEKIVERKTCRHCSGKFDITDKDLEFYEKVSPVFPNKNNVIPAEAGIYKNEKIHFNDSETSSEWQKNELVKDLWNGKIKYLIPTPTFCPDCRQQRRLSFLNTRFLYKRKCDYSWENIISMFSPDKKYKIYDYKIWRSNNWEGLDYGRNFDFTQSFFEQFRSLLLAVPKMSLCVQNNNENCDYINWWWWSKDCYMCNQCDLRKHGKLVPRIIEHMQKTWEWWEFFPSYMSCFWYNETLAQEYFPLSREKVLCHPEFISGLLKGKFPNYDSETSSEWQEKEKFKKWEIFNWSDYEAPFPKVEKIIPASKLPENISEIPDDILNWAIECEITKKPFRIIKQELEFYRKHNLPIPRRHPDQRHLDRMKLRNPRKLFDRKCDKCKKEIQTTYAPERSEIVYCENCYNKEIY